VYSNQEGKVGGYLAEFAGVMIGEIIPGAPVVYYDANGKAIDSLNGFSEPQKIPSYDAWHALMEKDFPIKKDFLCPDP
jgi:hypothetical protein